MCKWSPRKRGNDERGGEVVKNTYIYRRNNGNNLPNLRKTINIQIKKNKNKNNS